jgi:hypothetical protein
MCSPGAAQMGMQAIAGTTNFLIQDKASRDAIKYSESRSEVIGKAAVEDSIRKFSQLNRRTMQESERASRQIQAISRQAREAGGSIGASAGASGIEGNAVDALARDFQAQELARIEVTNIDLRNSREAAKDQYAGVASEAQNRIFNAQGGPVARPNIFAALFGIGSDMAAAYANNSHIEQESGKRVMD